MPKTVKWRCFSDLRKRILHVRSWRSHVPPLGLSPRVLALPAHSSASDDASIHGGFADRPEQSHQSFVLKLLGAIFLAVVASPAVASDSSPSDAPSPNRVPVQAVLVKAIEAGRVRVGDPVYATVDLAWNGAACKLREGAILKGRIVAQTPRLKGAPSEIALLFETGQCGGKDMKPLPLTIAAVLAPDPNRSTSLYGGVQSPPLSDSVGLSLGQPGSGSPMRSMLAAANTVLLEPPVNKPPVFVMPGQVFGMGNIKLAVASGPEGSSVLKSEKHNLRLATGSRLVLVQTLVSSPASSGLAPSKPSNDASTGNVSSSDIPPSAALTLADVDAINDMDACAPPSCNTVLDASLPELNLVAAASTIPLTPLGFAAPLDRPMYELGHGETVSYLGVNRLLFTFNPHVLVPRAGIDNELPNLHIVRAALIDLVTLRVSRSIDWRIYDEKRYLWPIGSDSFLVHAGRELRMYASDLTIVHRMPLNGPLAFANVAPSGRYFVVGIVRERHPESIHRELAAAEDRDPEEDVEVKVLDADFNVLLRVMRSSRDVPPVLSDDGEIRIPTIGKNRWRIAEYTWTGQRRMLKQVDSTCRPDATTIPPNLLFVTGCDRLADRKWYRVLRLDGKLVLKGQSSSAERGEAAKGISGSRLFAVGVTELTKSIDDSAAFQSGDLQALRVSVYRAESGQKITGVTLPFPLPTTQTFALSPDGRQLAVLASSQIVLYTLPQGPGHD